ncbi:MAG TPA: PLP-dependent aminotransferase family protein [Tahibacter sp.]|nr:PLP-dependent aminotransferase family protein [Tahibacter sp.]
MNRQVYAGLREAILDGTFGAGARLPSTRDLAEQLGISRTVVVLAYEQLLAEGYVIGRGGSGTYVPENLASPRPAGTAPAARIRLSRFGTYADATGSALAFPERPASPPRYDFAYGRSDVDCFPFEQWRRILQRRARRTPVRELDYGPPTGSDALRTAIAEHLKRSRAVVCDPSQVIVVSGSQQALDLVARVLIEPGDAIAIEDPSYQGAKEVLRAAGARIEPVAVDRDGLDAARLSDDARMAFVTPSHQFPTGAILNLARRQALLAWASRRNAVIVEDDYDGEFRYGGKPLESLQGLDAEGRVVYVGTFSRTVFSSLRIGYLVVPPSLLAAFTAAKWLSDRHTATLEQETLAEFIASGMYERHLRRVRRRNEAARDVLLDAVRAHLGDRVEVTGEGAGAHVVLWPDAGLSEDAIVSAALARGVGVYGIARYFHAAPSPPGLLLGYSRMREVDIREGVKRLGLVL